MNCGSPPCVFIRWFQCATFTLNERFQRHFRHLQSVFGALNRSKMPKNSVFRHFFRENACQFRKKQYLCTRKTQNISRGGAVVARWAHNPKVVGSNPSPATIEGESPDPPSFFCPFVLPLSREILMLATYSPIFVTAPMAQLLNVGLKKSAHLPMCASARLFENAGHQ